jgi:hypothetical protein
MPRFTWALIATVILLAPVRTVSAQQDLTQRVDQLTARVSQLESRLDRGSVAAVAFLFGAFCALWAQNTKRSAWTWFFLGVFFNVIAVLVLLVKNSDDLREAGGGAARQSYAVVLAVILGILLLAGFVLFWRMR